MQQEALNSLQKVSLNEDDLPWGIAIFQEDWHQGVIGILASRIKDRYHRPVIAFADAGEGEIKGSARSIKGLHMRDLLERINSQHPGMIIKFGGHAMAAGLSLKADAFEQFKRVYDNAVRDILDYEQLTGELLSDGDLSPELISLDTAFILRNAGPWGQSFEEPLFDGVFKIVQQRIVGEKHLKLLVETLCGTLMLDGIAFNIDLAIWPDATIEQARIVYKLDVNEFRGNQTVQLMVDYIEPM